MSLFPNPSFFQACPIDTRRALYQNITLSGGSTMFKHFDKRLERDINRLVKARADLAEKTGKPTEVNVVTSNVQRYAVWFGGSLLSSDVRHPNLALKNRYGHKKSGPKPNMYLKKNFISIKFFLLIVFQPAFYSTAHTRAKYQECGPSIARYNPVFTHF